MSDSATPWTVACQASLSRGFSRQEYQSGLTCPLPGDLPSPGLHVLLWQADSLPQVPPGKPSFSAPFNAPVSTLFPGGSVGKESFCNAGGQGSIHGSRRCPGEGNYYSLQYSCLENPKDSQRSLVGYSQWGHKESDTAERLTLLTLSPIE